MASINHLWMIGVIGLCMLSCAPSKSLSSQRSVSKSPTEIEAINMTDDEISLPIKKKAQPLSDNEVPSRSELLLPDFYDKDNNLPLINQLTQAEAYDGQIVRVVGKYAESDVRMKPIGTPRYVGHVSIVLADNTRVSLFPVWDNDARRPQEEIDRFKDLEVEVIGTFHRESPVDPRGGASLLNPCLTDIKALYHLKN